MKPMRTLIVEDEKSNVELLEHFLTKYCPNVEVIDKCLTFDTALHYLKTHTPDLVLLDIMLDKSTSFEILSTLKKINFQIIFVTAHEEYAIKAFQFNTTDYLLKPIQIEELILAINRAYERMEQSIYLNQEELNHIQHTTTGKNPLQFVTIANMDRVNFVKKEDINYCKSSGRYTEFFLVDGKKMVASKTLGDYEAQLKNDDFFRIHNSYLVNLAYIINISKKDGNYRQLNDGTKLPVSRRRMDSLIKYLRVE